MENCRLRNNNAVKREEHLYREWVMPLTLAQGSTCRCIVGENMLGCPQFDSIINLSPINVIASQLYSRNADV